MDPTPAELALDRRDAGCVNVASLGLIAAVTWQLGWALSVDPLTIALALISVVLLFRFRGNSTWLKLGGAVVEFVNSALRSKSNPTIRPRSGFISNAVAACESDRE